MDDINTAVQRKTNKARQRRWDALVTGLILVWVGVAVFTNLGWSEGLLGVGLILLLEQAMQWRVLTRGWHVYTPAQIEAARQVSQALVAKFRLKGVAGHDEIAPGRKVDPGPAFPTGSFRAHLFGRSEETYPCYRTTTTLNIRAGPGTSHERLPESPLSSGTRVEVLDESGARRYVALSNTGDEEGEVPGWVHGGYLERLR